MTEQLINIERMEHTLALFGSFDANTKLIEEEYNVNIVLRGTDIKVFGDIENVAMASRAIEGLLVLLNRGEGLTDQNLRYVMGLVRDGMEDEINHLGNDVICVTAKGRPLKAKTIGQRKYIDAIRSNTIVFGVGPCGYR